MKTRRELIKYGGAIAVAVQVPSFLIGCSREDLEPLKGNTTLTPRTVRKKVINEQWEQRAKQLEDSGIIKSRENIEDHHSTDEELKNHLPQITFGHNAIAMRVPHTMEPSHFITTVYVRDQDKRVFGLKELLPVDKIAWASFMVPAGTTKIYAFAFCSVHDHWCEKLPMQHSE